MTIVFITRSENIKELKKTTEITHGKWKTTSFYDKNGYLLSATNFYKKEIRSDYKYNYLVSDSLLEIKRTDTTNKDANKQERFDQYYYTSSGQCTKHRVYFSGSDNPSYFCDNFVYENEVLIGYTEAFDWQERNAISIRIDYKYNNKNQKIKKTRIFNETDTTFYYYIYNQSGQLTDYIQESSNNNDVYSDVIVWSDKKRTKYISNILILTNMEIGQKVIL